jgi:rSAM/selenodomain-associated transferase 2
MMPGMSTRKNIACIIPTLNAAALLPATLACLRGIDVVISDGGSDDDTRGIAEQGGAKVLDSAKGRGQQLAAGAELAIKDGADWLLFLHADTILQPGWQEEVGAFVSNPDNTYFAAVFRFSVDDNSNAARRLEGMVNWRTKALALPYGDQGLLISTAFYQSLGGFRALELMEDVDLVRRIGGKRIRVLQAAAMTSGDKYRQTGYLARSLRNLTCLGLFFLGVPVRWITRIYG